MRTKCMNGFSESLFVSTARARNPDNEHRIAGLAHRRDVAPPMRCDDLL